MPIVAGVLRCIGAYCAGVLAQWSGSEQREGISVYIGKNRDVAQKQAQANAKRSGQPMPQSDKPLDHLYEDRGWERTADGWRSK